MTGREYTFGQDAVAARRLRLLHGIFAPTSRALLDDVRRLGPFRAALDLGCGPGFTTRLLAESLEPGQLVGIDQSETFLELARQETPHARFAAHDLRQPPYPGTPADVIYARYVLSHLGDLRRWVGEWVAQLTPGGVLLIEENEWIEVPQPTFARYLELSREVMATQAADLWPGPQLPRISIQCGFPTLATRVVPVSGPTGITARMFRLNLRAWSRQPAARRHAAELARLDGELKELEASPARGEITWGLRQLAVGPPAGSG